MCLGFFGGGGGDEGREETGCKEHANSLMNY